MRYWWLEREFKVYRLMPGRVQARLQYPISGEDIQSAAKRVVKFRLAKAAKDAILGAR